MALSTLAPGELRLTIEPDALGFADTGGLLQLPVPWIGQERAHTAAHFGLAMAQPDYNLFVLGDVGSGRSSLLQQEMREMAAARAVPPDLCYLHNFDAPERPRALRLPSGQGRLLRQLMAQMIRTLEREIPQRLDGPDFRAESEHIEKTYKAEEAKAFAALDAFADARHFALYRENGHLVFTLLGDKGNALTESEARSLPKERRLQVDQAEQEMADLVHGRIDEVDAETDLDMGVADAGQVVHVMVVVVSVEERQEPVAVHFAQARPVAGVENRRRFREAVQVVVKLQREAFLVLFRQGLQ